MIASSSLTFNFHVAIQQQNVVFAHLENTGGTTFIGTLSLSQSENNKFYIVGLPRWDFFDAFRDDIQSRQAPADSYDRAANGIKIIHGHDVFGVDRMLDLDATTATMLRNPLERTISEFFWQKRFVEDRNLAFEQFIKFIDEHSNLNHYTYKLSKLAGERDRKVHHFDPTEAASTPLEEAYSRAVRNINEMFCFTGISEMFEESLFLFMDQLQVPLRHLAPWRASTQNSVRSVRPQLADIPAETRTKMEAATAADREIYEYCRARFVDEFARRGFDPVRLDEYKNMCGKT